MLIDKSGSKRMQAHHVEGYHKTHRVQHEGGEYHRKPLHLQSRISPYPHLLSPDWLLGFIINNKVSAFAPVPHLPSQRRQWHPTPVLLPGKIPWTEEPGGLQSMGSLKVGHDWVTSLSLFTFIHWRRQWQPTPVFLPGKSQGRRSLVGCHLWGRTESDTTGVT